MRWASSSRRGAPPPRVHKMHLYYLVLRGAAATASMAARGISVRAAVWVASAPRRGGPDVDGAASHRPRRRALRGRARTVRTVHHGIWGRFGAGGRPLEAKAVVLVCLSTLD